MPIVTVIYFTANLAYFAVVSREELLSSPAVAVVRTFCNLAYFIGPSCTCTGSFSHPIIKFSSTTEGKGKGRPRTGHASPEGEYMYSSALSLTSALDADG
jgi:hypothetical protein